MLLHLCNLAGIGNLATIALILGTEGLHCNLINVATPK